MDTAAQRPKAVAEVAGGALEGGGGWFDSCT